jgi:hypothetical protein
MRDHARRAILRGDSDPTSLARTQAPLSTAEEPERPVRASERHLS